jgi:hypothetical protein
MWMKMGKRRLLSQYPLSPDGGSSASTTKRRDGCKMLTAGREGTVGGVDGALALLLIACPQCITIAANVRSHDEDAKGHRTY